MRSKTVLIEHSLLIASVPRDEEHQISGRLAGLDRMGLRRHSNGNKSIRMPDPKSPSYGKGSQGREQRKGLNYEREFMHLEWLFRAREIFLPQGPMA